MSIRTVSCIWKIRRHMYPVFLHLYLDLITYAVCICAYIGNHSYTISSFQKNYLLCNWFLYVLFTQYTEWTHTGMCLSVSKLFNGFILNLVFESASKVAIYIAILLFSKRLIVQIICEMYRYRLNPQFCFETFFSVQWMLN